jgi:hypothetical protein
LLRPGASPPRVKAFGLASNAALSALHANYRKYYRRKELSEASW